MSKFRNLTIRFSAIVALFLLAFTVQLAAQSTVSGGIAGTVTDPTGAVVPNAKVTLKSVDSGQSQATTTNATGAYRFALLKPGRYTVSATEKGFRTTTATAAVSIGQSTRADIKLSVGESSQTVEVSAQTPMVQTDSGNTQTSYNTQQIDALPNPGGDITYVASTTPGIALNTSSGGGYGNFTSNGIPATSNSFTVNGTDEMDPYLNLNNSGASNLTLGANELSDATVTTNGYSGEYGRNAGAQINYTTKSGTNKFHGNASYDYTGASMMARDWFANGGAGTQVYQPNPNAQDQQWAASIGGPIVKNKTFFFVDTEGLHYKLPTSAQVDIPSPYYQQGTLTGDPAFLAAVGGTPLPAAEVPFYQSMFNLYNNAPGASGAVPVAGNPYINTFRSLGTNVAHEWLLIGRIDQQFSQNDKVFFRYKTDHGLQPTYTDPINSAFNAESVQPSYEGQLNWSHIFTPNMVNQFLASGSYYSAIFRSVDQAKATALFPYNSIFNADFTGLGGENFVFPQGRNVTQYQMVDDLSWTKGAHALKFGVNFRRNDVSDYSYSETYVTPVVAELGLGSFASGVWDYYSQNFPSRLSQPFSLFSIGLYAQDTWTVSPKLVLTLALRADHNGNPKCITNCFAELTTTFDKLSHDASVPYNQAIQNGLNSAFRGIESIVWQPRFGFAYTPFGNSNTAIRGGFGMFSDLFPGTMAEYFSSNLPQVASFNVFGGYAAPNYPGSAQSDAAAANAAFQQQFANGGTLASITNALNAQNVPFFPPSINVMANNVTNPKYLKWNFEVEHAIGTRNSVTLDYEGNHGYDLFIENGGLNAYTTNNMPGFPTAAPDPRFGTVLQYGNTGRSNYNGLTASFTRRYSTLTLNTSYTWSHSLDDVSGVAGEYYSYHNSITTQINPYNLAASYGNSDYDIRHYFQATYTYIPKHRFSNAILNNVLSGWLMSQTFFVRSGLPFSVFDSSVPNSDVLNYTGTLLANYSGGGSSCNSPYHACLTAADFTSPSTAGLVTNQRRNQFRGPGYFDSDLNLTKSFHLREGTYFTLGAQAFNVFNHPNFGAPVADLASSQFGTIQNTVSPPTSPFGAFAGVASGRIVQIQAKFNF